MGHGCSWCYLNRMLLESGINLDGGTDFVLVAGVKRKAFKMLIVDPSWFCPRGLLHSNRPGGPSIPVLQF